MYVSRITTQQNIIDIKEVSKKQGERNTNKLTYLAVIMGLNRYPLFNELKERLWI